MSLTMDELAFLLLRVKEAAQVEDDGQKEHKAGHSNDRHGLATRHGAVKVLAPQNTSHVHLKQGKDEFI